MSSEAETSLTISGAEVHSETLRDSSARESAVIDRRYKI